MEILFYGDDTFLTSEAEDAVVWIFWEFWDFVLTL